MIPQRSEAIGAGQPACGRGLGTRTRAGLPRFLLLLFVVLPMQAHDAAAEISLGIPPPPPTVDPGPDAARLRVRIVDAVSGHIASATACVNGGNQEPDEDPYRLFSLRRSANRHIGPIMERKIPYYFYTDGRFEVRVPPGPVSLEIRKGYEYRPARQTIVVEKNETRDVEIRLKRAIDMAALGWYSGDTHIHMERTGVNDDLLLTVTSAKDIRYAYLLEMNSTGYDPAGAKHELFRQSNGLGDKTVARRGIYHISSGQEYRTFRAGQLGHVTIALPDRRVPASGPTESTNAGPSLAVIADQTHALRGFIGLAHGGNNKAEADRLLLERKMDYLELLQFGDYRGIGLQGWYDFLNLGYRLPIVGASDFPPTRELSSEMSYAWCEQEPTPREFAEALAAGRSFATSGPMLFLTVAGNKPGAILRYAKGEQWELAVEIRVVSPQYPVKHVNLIVNGKVVEELSDDSGRAEWNLRKTILLRESAWIAARAYGDAGTDAHTNPVYAYFGDARPFNVDSVARIIRRLDDSIASVSVPEVVQRMKDLREEMRQFGESGRTSLPLPEINSP
jgi:hypothetical protein